MGLNGSFPFYARVNELLNERRRAGIEKEAIFFLLACQVPS